MKKNRPLGRFFCYNICMAKQITPLHDELENNPDKDYIAGEYSTFDREFSRAAKELEKKYNDMDNFAKDVKDEGLKKFTETFAKNMKLEYKKAIQNLVGEKALTQRKVVVDYFRTLRMNIMKAVLNNEILLDYALRFKDLHYFEKETFIKILDRILSDNMYHVKRSQIFYSPDDTSSAAYFSKRHGRGDDDVTSIGLSKHVETLDECINSFAHEFSHKIVSENPNMSPFGSQAAYIADKFYISSKEDKKGYTFNADELLAYAVQTVVSTDFEKDLRMIVAQREQIKNAGRRA